MANYKEGAITGTKWQRCFRISVVNPFGGIPVAEFHEEELISLGDSTLQKDLGMITTRFDQNASVALRDPATGDLTGETVSHAKLYQILFSAYRAAAAERDALVVA